MSLIILGVIVGLGAFIGGGWAFSYFTAPIRGAVNAEEQIESAASRIQNYQMFYDLYHTYQAQTQQLEIQRERLEQAKELGLEPKDIARIQTDIAALRAVRTQTREQYNSAASQQYTRARFLAGDLPYQISQ